MQIVLVGAGVACLIAAVAGVGIKALNVEIGAITNRGRQALLAVLGAGFLAGGFYADGGDGGASPKVPSQLASLPLSDRRLTPASVSVTSTLRPVPDVTYRAENLLDDDNTTALVRRSERKRDR